MDCSAARRAISARIDGELARADEGALTGHEAGCAGCRTYAAHAVDTTRRARLRSAPASTDLSSTVRDAARSQRPGLETWPVERVLLLVTGCVQLVLALPVLLGSDLAASLHVTHEVGVTDVALAAGLLAAAWQPWRAAGMLPVVLVLAVGLAVTSVLDISAGRVSALGELGHLLAPAGAVLLHRLRRAPSTPGARAAGPRLRAVEDPERRTG